MRDEILPQHDALRNSIRMGLRGPGLPYSESSAMQFSGRVFIYTMKSFTVIELGDLTNFYQSGGMSLQIRGIDYWMANNNR